jgi:peptide/nickel transport system substrate-binding protein
MMAVACGVILFGVSSAVSQIDYTEPWKWIEDPCVISGDVIDCATGFAVDGQTAVASVSAVVDQDWALFWSKRSSAGGGVTFSRRFTVPEATRVTLTAELLGRVRLEDTPGLVEVVAEAGVRDALTGLDVDALSVGGEATPTLFGTALQEEADLRLDDRAGQRRVVVLEAGQYLLWGRIRARAEIGPGLGNDVAEASFPSGFRITLEALPEVESEAEDRVIVPLGGEGTSYEALVPGQRGGTLYCASISNPKKWNHVTAHETSTTQYTNMMFKGLTDIDPNTSALTPELARGWTVSDDGLEIVFELRRGLRWSDGAPFTADDVVFTFNDLYFNEEIESDTRDILTLPDGTLPRVEKVDEHQVRVTLSTPFRPILTAMGVAILPRHVLWEYIAHLNPEVSPGTFNEIWGLDTDPSELVGIGPFIVDRYEPDQYVSMRRNPYYYHYDPNGVQLPYLDRYVVQIVENQDASLLKFRNGELDVLGIRASDVPILIGLEEDLGITVLVDPDVPVFGTSWVAINQDVGLSEGTDEPLRALFRDIRFRRAIAHALDKDTIINNVYNGLAVPQWSPVSYMSPFYAGREEYGGPVTEADAVRYEFSLETASALLDEIGIIDRDGDGWRDFEDETTVEVELNTGSSTTSQDIALIFTEDLHRVGLKVAFAPRESNTLVTMLLSATYEMAILGLTGGTEPNSGANVYGSCGGLHFWHFSGCEQPTEVELRIDELLAAGVSTYDNDEAFGIYKEYQTLLTTEDLGLVYTVNPTFCYAYYDHVGNAQVANPIATPSGSNGLTMDLVYLLGDGR